MQQSQSKGSILYQHASSSTIRLEYDVNPDSGTQHAFQSKYYDLTGIMPEVGTTDGYTFQQRKRSDQLRVYVFLTNTEYQQCQAAGIQLTKNDTYRKDDFNYRTSDRDVFWDLVSIGLRLGDNY